MGLTPGPSNTWESKYTTLSGEGGGGGGVWPYTFSRPILLLMNRRKHPMYNDLRKEGNGIRTTNTSLVTGTKSIY